MALSDWLKPKWQHSDPSVRLQAVRDLEASQTDLLTEIASSDADESVAIAAVSILADPDALGRVAGNDVGVTVLAAISKKLDQINFEVLVGDSSRVAREAALGRISNTDLLVKAAEELADTHLKVATIRRISQPEILGNLLARRIGKEAGLAALELISDIDILERAAESASNKTVRHAARDRKDAIIAEQNAPDPETQRRERLLELYLLADKLQDSWNWDFVAGKLAEAKDEWPRWDADFSDDLWPRVQAALANFEKRHAEFLVRQEEEGVRMAAREQAIAVQEALCDALDALNGRFDEESHQIFAQLRTDWEAAEPVSGDEGDALGARFQETAAKFEIDAVELAKTAKERAEVFVVLTHLCESAEALHSEENTGKARAEFSSLRRDWQAATADLAGLADIQARFDAAGDTLNAKSAAERDAHKAKRSADCTRIELLCEQVEALIESKERSASSKAVKSASDEVQNICNQDKEIPQALRRRFQKASRAFSKKQRELREAESWERWSNLQAKEALVQEVLALGTEEDLQVAAKQLKDIQARWKTVGPVPYKESDKIWNRFRGVCDAQYALCKTYFDRADLERKDCQRAKRDLIDRVHALGHSESLTSAATWEESATVIKTLQVDWKGIGCAGRNGDKELGSQFQGVCNEFFERRSAFFEAQDKLRTQHQADKTQLCEQVAALADSEDWLGSARAIRNLQEEWKEVGPAPREVENKLWEQFRASCNTFFERLDAVRPAHQAEKEALCDELEALLATEQATWNYRQMAGQIREMQKKWQAIGPADRKVDRELANRFRRSCNDFFGKRREQLASEQEERERNLAEKEELIYKVEDLADSTDWHETADQVKALQAKWKEIGPVPRERKDELWDAFRGACDRFFGDRNSHFAEKHNDRIDNLRSKEALCVRLEMLAKVDAPDAAPSSKLSVAEELKLAFESNWLTGAGTPNAKSNWQSGREEVKRIQEDWRKAGPVPCANADKINDRYRRACDAFYDQRPEPQNKETPEQMAQNGKRKSALCEKAAPFATGSDPGSHLNEAKRLMREWKKIGRVKSGKEAADLDKRFYDAVDVVFDAVKKNEDRQFRRA
ncbi:MAG: hypothetical protein ACI8W8_000600 [Rhodothermales bacterium]|jgi:hypothetical protein